MLELSSKLRIVKVVIIAFIFLIVATLLATATQATSKIYLFYGIGCPHCSEVEKYFEEENLFSKYPIEKKEIYFDRDNALMFNSLMDSLQVEQAQRGVPMVVLGNKIIVGDRPIIDNFITEADLYLKENGVKESTVSQQNGVQNVDLTIAAVIAGAIVDAVNPCEFAVLIILMTTILASGKAKRALLAGLCFSASIFISYFLMGLGLYTALGLGGMAYWFYMIVGWLAIVLGLLNLKDYFWYGKGFLMEVPTSWRPRLKSLINSVTSPMGAFVIGFLVSLFLLPCTSGPYIVILGMLAKKAMLTKTILYLFLYNLIFISPMILISLAVYKGFSPSRAEEIRQKHLRTLHLIAGLIMLVVGSIIVLGLV